MFAFHVKVRAGAVFIALLSCLMSAALGDTGKTQGNASKPVLASALDTVTLEDWMGRKPYPALIPLFEDLLQNHRPLFRVDSLYLLRGLARMTLANPETRKAGKAYLARVAAMNPGEPVWDIYADQLRKDYAQANEAAPAETAPTPTSNPAEENAKASTQSWYKGKGLWWAASGVGVGLIVAVITYVIMQDTPSEESPKHTVVLGSNSR